MQKIQVFLRDDQIDRLKRLSVQTGKSQSELVRCGVDLLLERDESGADWKQAAQRVFGVWADHETLKKDVRSVRKQLGERHERLSSQ